MSLQNLLQAFEENDIPKPYFLDIIAADGSVRQIYATEEQAAIIRAALGSKSNLLISALAGAAKTSTLRFICKYLPIQPILSLAFNKHTGDELTRVLPGHVKCQTMNSVGHRVWGTAVGKRLTVDTRKTYNIFRAIVEALSREDRAEAYSSSALILSSVGAAKRSGYIPSEITYGKALIDQASFLSSLDEILTPFEASLVNSILKESIRLSYLGTIDFDDQLYMPTLFGGTFPKFPLVLVDEAQDLSAINHAMLRKLVSGRLIAVGDPWQSIYAFRGAHQSGMDHIGAAYSCQNLPLSVSFRCPEAIVLAARTRVPHMKWSKPGGLVSTLCSLSPHDIPDGAAVVCRNNAPLYQLALILLSSGRGCQLVGTDLGPALVKTLKSLGTETLTKDEVHAAIDTWERERLAKARNKSETSDKAECLRVFAGFAPTLGGAIAYAEHLFSQRQGTIQLLSGHKAKGLEWPVVYHLDPWRIPSKWATTQEEIEQELNVAYVINTRAKESLYFINLDQVHS